MADENSKGPAKIQMPAHLTESLTTTPAAENTASDATKLIPASEVKPEDITTLSLRHVDGVPQLVVSGGKVIPAELTVVDASGKAVATYTAGAATQARLLGSRDGFFMNWEYGEEDE